MLLQRASKTITGLVGGRNLYCVTRTDGSLPPPGNYWIAAPTDDPVFGMVAVMVPAAAQGDPAASGFKVISPAVGGFGFKSSGGAVSAQKIVNYGASAFKVISPAAGAYQVENPAAGAYQVENQAANAANSADNTFVLSARTIPGRNSIVVPSGFADLMDALLTAGGTTVTVS
jgi:hypothetical protein